MSPNVTDSPENRMDIHQNARLTPRGREAMVRAVVDHGATHAEAAWRFNTSAKTVAKWGRRFRADGVAGLHDRSSRPLSSPSQTALATCDAVEALRRQRHTQAAIAAETGLSRATVSRILRARGLSLLSAIEPAEPRPRYERATPGEIIHACPRESGDRYQKARPFQCHRPSHHRQSGRPVKPALGRRRTGMGVRSCRHRRPLAPRFQPDLAQREAGQRRGLPHSRYQPLSSPWRAGRPRHDRQWQLL
jgi:transposase